MTGPEALRDIQGFVAAGRYRVSAHALERMRKRGVQGRDLLHAIANARTCVAGKDEEERWRVCGPDTDGDDLDVICALDDGVVIITVF